MHSTTTAYRALARSRSSDRFDDTRTSNNLSAAPEDGSELVESDTKVYFAAASASQGPFLFGYHLGFTGAASEEVSNDLGLTDVEMATVSSALFLGCLVGVVVGGTLSERFGRRFALMFSAAPLIGGSLLMMLSTTFARMLFGRIIAGIGVGITSTSAPLYVSEVSPARLRGWFGSFNQLMMTSGVVTTFALGYQLDADPHWWRNMLLFSMFPAAALFMGTFYFPETPRWLMAQNRPVHAVVALQRLRGDYCPSAPAELEEIQLDCLKAKQQLKGSWKLAFQPRLLRPLAIGVILQSLQLWTGGVTVTAFNADIFVSAGFSPSDKHLPSLLCGLGMIVITVVVGRFVDRVGRRPLLILSTFGMSVSLAGLGLYFRLNDAHNIDGVQWIGTVCVMQYVAFYSLGMGPIPWLVVSEIFPLSVRSQGVGVCGFAYWVSGFIVLQTFQRDTQTLGISGTFWMFGVIALAAMFFVIIFVPETKGRKLEEMEQLFISYNPLLSSRRHR